MTKPKIHLFLTLLLLGLPLIAAADSISHMWLDTGKHRIAATMNRQGSGFEENEVLSFQLDPDGKLLIVMNSPGFETPVLFQNRGESFVHVSTIPTGSGAFVSDTIFWIAPDGTMHEIEFENASETYEDKVDLQETVLTGGTGVYRDGDQLRFEFYIADNGDTHCCPTAGKVTGSYKIVGESKFEPSTNSYASTFKMVAAHYLRTPVSSGDIYAISR